MKIWGLRKRFLVLPMLFLLYGYSMAALSKNVEVYHVYGILPAFFWYTDYGLSPNQEASENGILVKMRKYLLEDDLRQHIIDHELVHVKQYYRTFFTSSYRVLFSQEYLAKLEAEAYAIALDKEEEVIIFSEMIQECYTPDVPLEKIEEYLRFYLNKRLSFENGTES